MIKFLKKSGEVIAFLILLYLCWSATFFITPGLFHVLSIKSLYLRQIINSFLGMFFFGLIMYGLSKIRFFQEKQSLFLRPMIEAMEKMAQGNFNIDLSFYQNEFRNRNHPFNEIAESITHMAAQLGEMEQMRQEFISNVSHEIQSPLTSISGFAHALKTYQLSVDERKQYLEIIEVESMRLSKLSENLLKLTSLESDHPPFETKTYRLDQQLRRVILSNEPQWRNKNLEMDVSLDEITIHADEDLMDQVWINLIHNSIKFTPNNGIIMVELIKKDSDKVEVIIKDTGIGMTNEVQMHIFERFYKADPSRSRTNGGSGLGLSIVKKIIEMHKGEIQLASSPNEGTEIKVLLHIGQ
ncbi:HAMP domain-containing sensor histidine kinase [Paenibacillus sp. BSR1-1]|uniref:sensor histidine kinase n=1 Tax=Paenibacillus sp. BSR1-1 TaxID=3020845 RepID=UPI0025B141C3|nr:HAMP domain-containing sensor histidine kinase [Paenibacillus sp. BSR1-1]MDN3017805.1 HAMP domain-containing sensor histidine kinase [Paenibacillus sp. BSR1-1]